MAKHTAWHHLNHLKMETHENLFLNDATPPRGGVIDNISSSTRVCINDGFPGDDDSEGAAFKIEIGIGTGRRRGDAVGDGAADTVPGFADRGGGGGGLFTPIFKSDEDDAERK
jgi:hypothetical protein